MWVTSEVELPDELVAAQRERRLVVFVGSGASVGKPADLPTFQGLTRQIAQDAQQPFDETRTDFDVFLGELEERSVDVHLRARAILSNPASRPTAIHSAAVGLFSQPEDVRIVTTNYDSHLTTTVRERFGDKVEIFRAPALPIGRDFTGLVYLHGSVDQEPRQLVVTDRDFGSAYLVDAWAARFLEAMFHHSYEVLFVGYSHSDVVMRYLARGLRGSTKRYGLIDASRSHLWRPLQIRPISYPVVNDDHGALERALLEWVRQANMGFLDHERRIAELLRTAGVVDPAADSYLANALTDPITTGFFCAHAEGLPWLPWLEGQSAFKNLFDPTFQHGEIESRLASWFAVEIAVKFPSEGLSCLRRQGGRFSQLLGTTVTRCMWGENRPPSAVVRRWINVLLDHNPGVDGEILSYVLAECQWPDDRDLALSLFDYLTTPKLALRPGFGAWSQAESSQYPEVSLELSFVGEEYWLRKAWEEQFKPHLAGCAADLSVTVTRNLLSCWRRQILFQTEGGQWDALSAHRSAIEAHQQDSYLTEVDILINAARDVLEQLLSQDDGSGPALLQQWSQMPGALFHRLVIHGWTYRPDKSSDEKLEWLLDNERLVEGGPARHEAFRLVAETLASATQAVKMKVLEASLQPPQVDYEAEPESLRYVTYNLVYWLTRSDPSFDEARREFDRLQSESPDFVPREHPDLDRWSSSGAVAGPSAPITLEELLSLNLSERMDWLLTYQGGPGTSFFGPNRSGLLELVSEATAANFAWSRRLVQQLQAFAALDSDLWEAIFQGWEKRPLGSKEWVEALQIIKPLPHPEQWLRTLTRLLKEGGSEQGGLTKELLPDAELVARNLWTAGVKTDSEDKWVDEGSAMDRWLDRAVNHWAGDLAMFWAGSISKQWRADPEGWNHLPLTAKEALERMLDDAGHPGDVARAILAGLLLFFHNADEQWAVNRLIPLFDWEANHAHAEQAWDGYLTWGQWNDRILSKMLPYFCKSFGRLNDVLASRRHDFCTWLAGFALNSSLHPLEDGWLKEFIVTADEESAIEWARAVDHVLRDSDPSFGQAQWERWISSYWKERDEGIPKPVTASEAAAMVPWLMRAGDSFPDGVALAAGWPVGLEEHGFFLYRLKDEAVVDNYPSELTSLLARLLGGTAGPFFQCDQLGEIVPRLAPHAVAEDYVALCNEAARLGCNQASSWGASLLPPTGAGK